MTAHGADNIACANTLNNIANTFQKQGKYDDALEYSERALKISVATHGADNIACAEILFNIAQLFFKSQNFERALPILDKVISIYRRFLGDSHSFLIGPLILLCQVFCQVDRATTIACRSPIVPFLSA